MTDQELEKRLEFLNKSIDELCDERYEIQQKIQDANKRSWIKAMERWDPQKGDYYMLFSKEDRGYHWSIAKVILITEVDSEHMFMDTITSDYHESDYEYWCKTENNRVHFSNLSELENDFSVYKVSETGAIMLQHEMNLLLLTYNNYKEFENRNRQEAIKKIS